MSTNPADDGDSMQMASKPTVSKPCVNRAGESEVQPAEEEKFNDPNVISPGENLMAESPLAENPLVENPVSGAKEYLKIARESVNSKALPLKDIDPRWRTFLSNGLVERLDVKQDASGEIEQAGS